MRTTTLMLLACVLLSASCGGPPGGEVREDDAAASVPDLARGDRARTTGNLNLRDGPGTDHRVLLVMPLGAEVDVGDRDGKWYAVVYQGTAGWASGAYLEKIALPEMPQPGDRWRPAPGTSWQWQLSGTIDTSFDVKMYDVDLFETPQATIDRLHAAGRIVICYFSAGSYEPNRPDSASLPRAAIGRVMDGWPDERWLDVRSAGVRAVMSARLDVAVSKRCDGVEPDNVDGYSNATGFSLAARDQLDYNRFLASESHARNLSVGLKNDLDQVSALAGDFDWALNEECFAYGECDALTPFIDAGKAVFQVEYGGSSLARRVCGDANARGFDTLIKSLELGPSRISCR